LASHADLAPPRFVFQPDAVGPVADDTAGIGFQPVLEGALGGVLDDEFTVVQFADQLDIAFGAVHRIRQFEADAVDPGRCVGPAGGNPAPVDAQAANGLVQGCVLAADDAVGVAVDGGAHGHDIADIRIT